MIRVRSEITPNPETAGDRQLSNFVHDLRTPLNHIIGLSEMLLETAAAEGQHGMIEGLTTVREGGIELASLLEDRNLIAMEAKPGFEYWPLTDASRAAISRVLGFANLILSEPPSEKTDPYRDDLELIRSAAQAFFDLTRTSGLLIRLETARHWDERRPEVPFVAVRDPAEGGRILIVDDEGLNREVLCRRLQREGFRPTGVHSGREALHLLRSESFDVVLLDIQMPEMSGMEVLQILKHDEQLRHLPVIMLSALADVDRVAKCIELGAQDYLPKPINAVLLRARLGACLEQKRLRDQEQAHLQALHTEKERLSVTLRSLVDAVVTTDDRGRVVLINAVASQFTGLSAEEATGRSFTDVFRIYHRLSGEPTASVAAEALAQKVVLESEEGLALKLPDDRERLVSVRCSPICDAAGQALGTVVVVRDVTEKEKMAEELLRASKLQSIGVLAGGLAHDFNNMLTAVLGNLSLLKHRQSLPSDLMHSIDEAERGALRAQDLTRYLLTFADGGAPMKQMLRPKSFIEQSCAFALRGSNIQCEFRLSSDLWETEVDPNQIAQAISNVVLNAIEATPTGGQIAVTAENATAPFTEAPHLPAGDYLRVAVRDRGTGISSENLSRIYDPFFTTKKQARGLGLAAAYSIIQRHDGHITVDSMMNVGTTVTIYLPAVRPSVASDLRGKGATSPAAPPVDTTLEPAGERRERVLLMDDEEPIRTLVETMLDILGYDVVTTADGDAALAAHEIAHAEGQPFDLVIMDLTIPGGMGGREAIRRLRERDQTIRAIVSSGYSNDPVMANYADYGFDAVLPKPYMMKDLGLVLKNATRAEGTPTP